MTSERTWSACALLVTALGCSGGDATGDGASQATTGTDTPPGMGSTPPAMPGDSQPVMTDPLMPSSGTGAPVGSPTPPSVGGPTGPTGAQPPSTDGVMPPPTGVATPGDPVMPNGGSGPVGTPMGMGGMDTGVGGGPPPVSGDCTIEVTSEVSEKIPTVGIVQFTTDATPTAASIEFGPDTNYGMTAPVDLEEAGYRTLLLGMKASSEYHFRVVVESASGACAGGDNTITTGALAVGLPNIEVSTPDPGALFGGFLLTGQYVQGAGGSGAPAYILDTDGEIVWYYNINSDVTGARMSYDGKYMWINGANVPDMGAHVRRVAMDGSSEDNFDQAFDGQNHQLIVLPDESVVFYAYGANQCDDIKRWHPDGSVDTIVNSCDAHGGSPPAHLNGLDYSKEDDTLIFSDLQHNALTKITMTGERVWVLGGTNGASSDFTGDGASWQTQHNMHALAEDRVLFFNNGGPGQGSLAIEVELDLMGMTARRAWEYAAMPSISNQIMGDVQRLPNGNTMVAYSTQGVVHEVDASGKLLQEHTWPIGGAFGYIEKRETLYGPPPR